MKKLIVMIAVAALAGCAAMNYEQGTKISDADYDKMLVRFTNSSNALSWYGAPEQQTTDPATGNIIYVYHHSVISPIPGQSYTDTFNFTFSKLGILIGKNRQRSNGASSNALTGKS